MSGTVSKPPFFAPMPGMQKTIQHLELSFAPYIEVNAVMLYCLTGDG
jgi:hypothetical protein